jgi:TPR repeat protein
MRSGDAAMVRGDIMRARVFYERAAGVHPASSAAPVAVGKTYDPNLLPVFGGSSNLANTARAAEWYQRARDLGDPTAAALLASLR